MGGSKALTGSQLPSSSEQFQMAPAAGPVSKRGPWSSHEDITLLRLVDEQGPHNWVRIATYLASRSPKQCRERYHQNLKPSLSHEPISPEEGERIERMVAEMGKRGAEIARRLPGRSAYAVKNWWNGGMNRRRRIVVRREGSARGGPEFDEKSHSLAFARPPPPSHRPILIPTPHASRRIEQPLTSPANSEVSMPDSIGEAPSLVSDSSSHFSMSSPNAITNSHRFLPLPLETSHMDAWRPGPAPHINSSRHDYVPPPNRSLPFYGHGEVSKSTHSQQPCQRLQQFAEVAVQTPGPVRPNPERLRMLPSQRPLPSVEDLLNDSVMRSRRPVLSPISVPSSMSSYPPAQPRSHQIPDTTPHLPLPARSLPSLTEPSDQMLSRKRKAVDEETSSRGKKKMSVSNIVD